MIPWNDYERFSLGRGLAVLGKRARERGLTVEAEAGDDPVLQHFAEALEGASSPRDALGRVLVRLPLLAEALDIDLIAAAAAQLEGD